MANYTLITDPGHGWLQVPETDVLDLGIEGKISACSYYKAPFVYLEEDCDAPLFMNARKAKGLSEPWVSVSPTNEESVIRTYSRYSKRFLNKAVNTETELDRFTRENVETPLGEFYGGE